MPVATNVYTTTAALVVASGLDRMTVRLPGTRTSDLLALQAALTARTRSTEWAVGPAVLTDGTVGAHCVRVPPPAGLTTGAYVAHEAIRMLSRSLKFASMVNRAYGDARSRDTLTTSVSMSGSTGQTPGNVALAIQPAIDELGQRLNIRRPTYFHILPLLHGFDSSVVTHDACGISLRANSCIDMGYRATTYRFDVEVSG